MPSIPEDWERKWDQEAISSGERKNQQGYRHRKNLKTIHPAYR
jgi:hypothetical protein